MCALRFCPIDSYVIFDSPMWQLFADAAFRKVPALERQGAKSARQNCCYRSYPELKLDQIASKIDEENRTLVFHRH